MYRTDLFFFLVSPLLCSRTKQQCKVCAVSVCQSPCKDFYYAINNNYIHIGYVYKTHPPPNLRLYKGSVNYGHLCVSPPTLPRPQRSQSDRLKQPQCSRQSAGKFGRRGHNPVCTKDGCSGRFGARKGAASPRRQEEEERLVVVSERCFLLFPLPPAVAVIPVQC